MARSPKTTTTEPEAPKPDKRPEAAPTTQAPIEDRSEAPTRGELDPDVAPAEDCVRDVAVQLAMQDGERRPFNIIHGRPVWEGYVNLARAGLTAQLYLEKRRGH